MDMWDLPHLFVTQLCALAALCCLLECKPDEEELQYWREVDQEQLVEEEGGSSSDSEQGGGQDAADQDNVSIGSGGL
jgi:hypothetical protein